MISGALSYDNLNLVNGVNVNENLRQQARPLYVEDAVQETKVSTGNISAEYGRFQGGVVNMITKSGGNNFSGSFRTTFTNDGWKALTPFPGDANIDQVVPAYEMTFGGPILKDKLWFFTSGRYQNNQTNLTMAYTGYNYTYATDDTRLEGKATYALTPRNNFKFSVLQAERRLHEQQLRHRDGCREPVQQQEPGIADGGELPVGRDEQPVPRHPVLGPPVRQQGHRLPVHGPHQGHADLGPAARDPLQHGHLLRGVRQRRRQEGQRRLLRQAELLPLDEEHGFPQFRGGLRLLQRDADEQPELGGQRLPRAGPRIRHRRLRRLPDRGPRVVHRLRHVHRLAPRLPGHRGQRPHDLLHVRERRLAHEQPAHDEPRPALRQEQHAGPGRQQGRQRLGLQPASRRDLGSERQRDVDCQPRLRALRRDVQHADRRRGVAGRPRVELQLLVPGPGR